MGTVCAQPDGSMSSLLQSTGSSPYVLDHSFGPLAATVDIARGPIGRNRSNRLKTGAGWNKQTTVRNNTFHLMQEVEILIFSGNVVAHWNRKNCVDGTFRCSNSGTFATLTRDLYRKTC